MASKKCAQCGKWAVDWGTSEKDGKPYHRSFLESGVCPIIRTPASQVEKFKAAEDAEKRNAAERSVIQKSASTSPDRGTLAEEVREQTKIGADDRVKSKVQYTLPANTNIFQKSMSNEINIPASATTNEILSAIKQRFPNIRCDQNGEIISFGNANRFDNGKEEPIDEDEVETVQKLLLRATELLLLEAKSEENALLFTKLKEIADDKDYQNRLLSEHNLRFNVELNSSSAVVMRLHGNKLGQAVVLKKIIGNAGTYDIPDPPVEKSISEDDTDTPVMPPWEIVPDCTPDQQIFGEITLDVPFPSATSSDADRAAFFEQIAADKVAALSLGNCEKEDLEALTQSLMSRIQIKDIYKGSTHVIFAILPQPPPASKTTAKQSDNSNIKTPREILKAIKTILLKDNSTKSTILPEGFKFLNHIIVENGISASPDPIYVDLITQAKKWIKENWSPSNPPDQSFGNLQLHENLFVTKECCCYQRFKKGMQEICKGDDSKLGLGFGKNQFQFGYHGTSAEHKVGLICHDGWDPKFRSGQAYGKGEYFTKAGGESYSISNYANATQKIILAVILGNDNPLHWSSKNPFFVVNNPLSATNNSALEELPSYCLPVIIISWGPTAPKFECPPTCQHAKKGVNAVEVEVEALLINPNPLENKDEYYKVRVLKNGTVKMSYDVVATTGSTGTIPFGPGSQSTMIGANLPTYDSAVHVLKKEFTSKTGLDLDNCDTKGGHSKNEDFEPGKWFSISPPPPIVSPTTPIASPKTSSSTVQASSTPPPPLGPTEVMWQFYDKQRGGDGWHNYKVDSNTRINSVLVLEQIFQQQQSFQVVGVSIPVRSVKSGEFNYLVDFSNPQPGAMGKQINVTHKTERIIRRTVGSKCTCSVCADSKSILV